MNCDRFLELLDDYRRGLLTGPEAGEVESHLADCAACREALAEADAIGRLLRDAQPALPGEEYFSGLHGRVLDRMAAEDTPADVAARPAARVMDVPVAPRPPRPLLRRWSTYAAAAVLLVAVGLSTMHVPQGRVGAGREIAMTSVAMAPQSAPRQASKAEVARERSFAVAPAEEDSSLKKAAMNEYAYDFAQESPVSQPLAEPAASPVIADTEKKEPASASGVAAVRSDGPVVPVPVDAREIASAVPESPSPLAAARRVERNYAGATVLRDTASPAPSTVQPAASEGAFEIGPAGESNDALPRTELDMEDASTNKAGYETKVGVRLQAAAMPAAKRDGQELSADAVKAIAQTPARVVASAASPSPVWLFSMDGLDGAKDKQLHSAENEMLGRAMQARIPRGAARAKGRVSETLPPGSAGLPASSTSAPGPAGLPALASAPAPIADDSVPKFGSVTGRTSAASGVETRAGSGSLAARAPSAPAPGGAERIYLEAESARLAGRHAAAFEMYSRVVQAAPGTALAAQAELRIGDLAYEKLNSPDTAVAAYRRCIAPPLSAHLDEATLQAVRVRLESLSRGTPSTPAP